MNAESRLAKAAPEVHAGGLNSSSLHLPRRDFPAKIRLCPPADAYLDDLAAAIIRGEVGLHQLSGGLLAVVSAIDLTRHDALAAMTSRVTRLEYERDLWYFVANNPGKRPGDFAHAATRRLWAEAATR